VTPVVAAAATDSLAHAAALAQRAEWIEFAHGWHEFFLMAGTAAVTLAGLLFVAISIHVDALVHESRQHLLALSRLILVSYMGVLVLSLMMLVPLLPMKLLGVELIAVAIPLLAWTVRLGREKHLMEHADFSSAVLRRRSVIPLLAYLLILLTGILMLTLRVPEFFYWIVGAVCTLLGNAVGASWDLLVRTAKTRRQAELSPEASGAAPGAKKADVG